ncbi:hypothetical protein FS837_000614 [Tulasnella sp. UAMH 9824]|nr:hypothetical protein FS837_000614 [Tulasnella sp. UAMH 9824]
MFINDVKVHLTVLQWFWEAIRGPQEIIPEYDFIHEDNFDWSILPVDILPVLWMCAPAFQQSHNCLANRLRPLLSIAGRPSSNLRNKLLDDLVVEGDLIMALGRWFLADQVTQFQKIAKQYVKDRRFVAMYIEPTRRHVLKSRNSVKRSGVQTSKGDKAAQIWLTFGGMFGLAAHPNVEGSVQKGI